MSKKNSIVTIGGSGVIGRHLAYVCKTSNLYHCSLSLSRSFRNQLEENIEFDVSCYRGLNEKLENIKKRLKIIALIDICGASINGSITINMFVQKYDIPFILISSCLLYKRNKSEAINESCLSHTASSAPNSYIKKKIKQEFICSSSHHIKWTIVRTHHIVGKGTLLGATPFHNRDNQLIDRINKNQKLKLLNAGKVKFSFINPNDLANIIIHHLLSDKYHQKIVNLIHPKPVNNLYYYQQIAKILGKNLNYSCETEMKNLSFWSITSFNNIYCSKYFKGTDYQFRYSIEKSIQQALKICPEEYKKLGRHMVKRIS